MRDGWVETSLDDIADVTMGQSPDGKSYNELGEGIPFMQGSAEFGDHYPIPEKWCSDPKKIAEPGDLLLSVRAPVGDTNFADQRIAVGRGLSVIRANEKSVTEYIRLVIQLNVSEMIASSGTGMFASITGSNLRKFKVLVPPISEQRRIVDLVNSVDSYIEALQQQLESVTRSRNAVLHELVTAGDQGWTEKTLKEVTVCSWGNTEITKSKYVDSGYLAYSASGADGLLEWFEHDRSAVILSAIGAQCGKTWFAEGKWTAIKNTIWLKADNNELLDKYLFYLSNKEHFWQIRGQAQPFISLGDVKKTKVLLPPLTEQKTIVEIISSFDESVNHVNRTIEKSKNLRSGLLSDLLSGEHEIPASYDKVMDTR